MSKSIAKHKSVQEVLDGFEQNFDYKYHVYLKDGWLFTWGRMRDSRTGNFNTVKEFFDAVPRRI